MTILVKNEDGTTSTIPGAKWHPEHVQDMGVRGKTTVPACLWTTVDAVVEHYKKINTARSWSNLPQRDLDRVIDGISCAEAPFEIYAQCEDGEPWKHNGLLARSVPYGQWPDFWNNHA